MRKLVITVIITAGLVMGVSARSFASDWDKAGKVLAVFEGLRVLTGGRADIIGTITGINSPRQQAKECDRDRAYAKRDKHPQYYAQRHCHTIRCERRVWVPHMVWEEKYVLRHTEYRPGLGEVVVEGHYERYLVEQGGHWEITYDCKY